ncbi:MAG: metal ABC transporter substrate-binding protein [Clostridiales bacterium]|jgi:D-methionine transport system substrate-binding protein|nr:metal ABC transporter substrate-binding protein [Clostridiales bacterium]
MKKLFLVVLVLLGLFALAACGNRGGEVTRIGATAMPHMVILEQIAPILEEQGFSIELVEFDDFQTPNIALNDGDIDINFFQHRPFLNGFNAANNTDLIPVFGVHFEPLRVYAGRLNSLENLPNGASIAIPEDATNQARALQLLESIGLISLYPGLGLTATVTTGIAENPHNLDIQTMTAQVLPRILPDVDFAVVNGNVALQGNIIDLYVGGASENPQYPTGDEFGNLGNRFTNFVVVRNGEQNEPVVAALIEAINSPPIRDFINAQYQGSVVPMMILP